jgi:hypothetical protein
MRYPYHPPLLPDIRTSYLSLRNDTRDFGIIPALSRRVKPEDDYVDASDSDPGFEIMPVGDVGQGIRSRMDALVNGSKGKTSGKGKGRDKGKGKEEEDEDVGMVGAAVGGEGSRRATRKISGSGEALGSAAGASNEVEETEIEILDITPVHLKRKTNEDRPIIVYESDDEASPVSRPSSSKRRRVSRGVSQGSSRKSSRTDSVQRDIKPVLPPESDLADVASEPLPRLKPELLIPTLLDFIPDICPKFALELLTREMAVRSADEAMQRAIHLAYEMEGGYPRVEVRRVEGVIAEEKDDTGRYRDAEYRKEYRKGGVYADSSMELLSDMFLRMPTAQ